MKNKITISCYGRDKIIKIGTKKEVNDLYNNIQWPSKIRIGYRDGRLVMILKEFILGSYLCKEELEAILDFIKKEEGKL